MRNFACPVCGNRIYFENSACTACGTDIAFDIATVSMVAATAAADGAAPRLCANRNDCACNWIATASDSFYCVSCGLNQTIPPIADPVQRRRWTNVEIAKRRLVYDLRRLSLAPLPIAAEENGLAFSILVDADHGGEGQVTMGHEDGLITIDAAEADPDNREQRRVWLGEEFRTMLGHMRHESGHYFWNRLQGLAGFEDAFRALFGDERADYAAALARHYEQGPPADWQLSHVSAYATSHPWEDWAETFAHYLHMIDGLETFGTAPTAATAETMAAPTVPSPGPEFGAAIDRWIEISIFMNSMSRSLGHNDAYPFVYAEPFRAKLAFVHEWLGRLAGSFMPEDNQSAA